MGVVQFINLRAALTLTASALAIVPGLAGAQTPSAGQAPGEADGAIIVVGYRAQNEQAAIAKRADERVAEYLSSDDIGGQPDYNIADALRRVAGVQTQFDEDEGRYVAIRGLDPSYTLGALDGATLATAERQNRQLNMEAVPAGAVRQVVVTKSRTPDVDGNAIGGTLNLVTRSAFDSAGFYAAGTAMSGLSSDTVVPGEGFGRDYDDAPNWRFDATMSNRFGPGGQFGVLLGVNYLQRNRDQQRLLPQQIPVLNLVPTPVGAPTAATAQTDLLWSNYPNTITRYGGLAKLEWSPNDTWRTGLVLARYTQDDNELRHSQRVRNGTGSNASFVRFNDFPLEKPLTVAKADITWDPGKRQRFEARASYSEATFLEPSNQIQFNLTGPAASFDLVQIGDGVPFASNLDPRITNPASYALPSGGWLRYEDDSDEYVQEYAADYAFNTARRDRGWGFGVGVKWREIARDNDRTQWNYAVSGPSLTLERFLAPARYQMIYSSINQLFVDFDAVQRFQRDNPSLVTVARDAARQSDWLFEERVKAVYALARHGGERHRLIFGGRFEDTATSVERNRTAGSVQARVTREGGYDNFLPSVTFSYDITPALRLRAAAFQAVGRPNPSQLAAGETVNQTTGAISRGNPDLQARKGDSYEAALEFYPSQGGVIAAGLFRKEIANEIVTRLTPRAGPNGEDVTQPVNVTTAEVNGLELSAVVPRLPLSGIWSDFGIAANATFIDGGFDTGGARGRVDELQGQSPILVNVAVFYERGPLRARLAYAYIGEARTSVSAADASGLSDRYDRATNTIDTQLRYAVSDRVELIGEVRNLTNEDKVNFTGPGVYRDVSIYGRQGWLGASYRF